MSKAKKESGTSLACYDDGFFDIFFKKIKLNDIDKKNLLKKSIAKAAKSYTRSIEDNDKYLPPSSIKRELKVIIKNLENVEKRLRNISSTRLWEGKIISNMRRMSKRGDTELESLLSVLYTQVTSNLGVISSGKIISIIKIIKDSIKETCNENKSPKIKSNKSTSIEQWIICFSYLLEDALGRPLKQTRYTKKVGYIGKSELSDSELLQYLLKPIDKKITVGQLEEAIKETKEMRQMLHKEDLSA